MLKIYLSLMILGSIGSGNWTYGQKIIDLRDYGVLPNSFENASPAIVRALNDAAVADSAVIRFPGGRIDLWPTGAPAKEYYVSNTTEPDSLSKVKTVGILLNGLKNITLEGNGTLLMVHGKMVHLVLDHCRNIKVKGLRFDYERPTMSEMEVVKMTDTTVTVQVNPDSRYWIQNRKITWYGDGWKSKPKRIHMVYYRPSLETMYYGKYRPFNSGKVYEPTPGKLIFKGDFLNSEFQEGDILTFRDVYRDCLGILNNYSQNIVLKDIYMHYMHGMGIVSQFSKNIHINNFRGKPRKESGRTIAAFADFLHFSGCYGKITVENSLFSGSHDDDINIHGTHLRISESNGHLIKVRFMHEQTWNLDAFEKGDSIAFVDNKTLLTYGDAIVRSVGKISKRELQLELDRPAPKELREKHCVENLTKTPEVVIRNNRFEHTNTRGLLLTSRRKAIVEDNVFFRTGMHAILIADDCNYWYESGPVTDVTIRNNQFIQCGYNSYPDTYPIAIMPETHTFLKNRYVHKNIRITGNEFTLFAPPLLFARSARNIIFTENEINGGPSPYFPNSTKPVFFLEHCTGVRIKNNRFKDSFPERIIELKYMDKDGVDYGSKTKFKLINN
ncbi:right-handed parallel beta-helix repeat-containing protein [Flavobacteriaceae bacterium F89]|uniref:Right-handed parallel beta-helix repeat-containing protein n=1 Tax=Cerina litoralis TaxID=2874477 RepID=A0AAE3EUT3_9FLAO|nr:right-handed parallel beta-helix repeat-containing protein [Cerina litoralis]MCG2461495.1 right-handed parallel beta-helix repeat-containing protein [Cerina litoralis]